MARIKPQNTITSRAQAEAGMAKLNNIDQQLAAWDLAEANAIAAVREQHAAAQRQAGRPGLEAEKALLVKELEAWATEDKERWDKKTQETPFGTFGFRVSQPAVVLIKKIASKLDTALLLLKQHLPQYVRDVPQIDKEKILADDRDDLLDETALIRCGLKVHQEDEFWIETSASKDLETAAQKLRAA
jgi:phage host-nuclease inhibitor protein Gam